jgi:hypothetical protein
MPIIPSVPMSLAATPADTHQVYPWRFRIGSLVYVVGRPLDATYTVIGGELWMGFPHLHLHGRDGTTWRVAQLHCSSKPITYRKG